MNNKLVVLAGISEKYRKEVSEEFRKREYFVCNNTELETIQKKLKAGKDVLYNHPNTTYMERKKILNAVKDIECRKTCIIVAVPYEECKEDVEEYYKEWETPYYYEGWDKISVSLGKYKGYYGKPEDFIEKSKDYDLYRKNHSNTLGMHCYKTYENVKIKAIKNAALLHDCGKIYTQEIIESKNENGETIKKARYKNHNNVGSYNSFFYEQDNPLLCSVLVGLHMKPYEWDKKNNTYSYNIKNELSAIYKKRWGKDIYHLVMALHKADKKAH